MDGLRGAADQMRFDAATVFVVARLMLKLRQVEIRAEFTIDPRKQIQVKCRRHTQRI